MAQINIFNSEVDFWLFLIFIILSGPMLMPVLEVAAVAAQPFLLWLARQALWTAIRKLFWKLIWWIAGALIAGTTIGHAAAIW